MDKDIKFIEVPEDDYFKLLEEKKDLKEEIETQKKINKECEVEYRRVVSQYNSVVEQNRQLQNELSKYRQIVDSISEIIKTEKLEGYSFCDKRMHKIKEILSNLK